MNTQRLESDHHFGGLGADQEVGCGGGAEGTDRAAVGDLADHGHQGDVLGLAAAYERAPGTTSFAVFEPAVRALLEDVPDMPATVLAERVGWTGSIRWFSENVKRLRPEHLWFPPDRRGISYRGSDV